MEEIEQQETPDKDESIERDIKILMERGVYAEIAAMQQRPGSLPQVVQLATRAIELMRKIEE